MVNSESTAHNLSYTLSGLKINSNLQIADLERSAFSDGHVDVSFENENISKIYFNENWLLTEQPNQLPTYISNDGRNIVVIETEHDINKRALEIRRVIPYASYLQNKPILHASSILYKSSVLGFVGESGAGKSTFAQALQSHSYELVSDDLMALREVDNGIWVPLLNGSNAVIHPLSGLFFLKRDNFVKCATVKKLSKVEALDLLITNSFGDLVNKTLWSNQFEFISKLVEVTDCYSLEIPDDISKLKQTTYEFLETLECIK